MNVLKREKQETAIAMLAEGSSIRSIERVTGVHRDTIMRLGVRIGDGCANLMKATMRDVKCRHVEVDETWTYVGKKQRHFTKGARPPQAGDFWIWCAIDEDTKVVPCYRVGKRTTADAVVFITDLARRVSGRIQLSSDALRSYIEAVEVGFGGDVDYGQVIKTFESEPIGPGRYSPPRVSSIEERSIVGNPKGTTTSHAEKLNHTLRMHNRRLTRLTNAFSKKRDNLEASIGLFYAYYNFVKRHGTLRMPPAMAAGVTNKWWSLSDLIDEAEAHS